MLQDEVFVRKRLPVNRFPTGSVVVGKIAALAHEIRYYSVKRGVLKPTFEVCVVVIVVIRRRFTSSSKMMIDAQPSEILARLRTDVVSEDDGDSTQWGLVRRHV
jgi:hypothetical protein